MPKAIAAIALVIACPLLARAAGNEFPAGGTRGLGRGGAAMARADDPSSMVRNPALLADLWGDQALLGSHLLLADACVQPSGFYGYQLSGSDVADFGDGPVVLSAPPGTDNSGAPLRDFANQPYHRVCFEGPAPLLPSVAVSVRLGSDLGLGLGFFPPDSSLLAQWGNADGTIDTPDGRRPNPLRFMRSNQYASVLPLMGAFGYRLAPWLSVGAGFSWTLVAFNARTWSAEPRSLSPSSNIRVDLFGRDLFVPGFSVSAQLTPIDALDISLGFRWSDRVQSKAKLDITTGAFGVGELEIIRPDGTHQQLAGRLPTTVQDVAGEVDAPPITVPQLSLGVRFADRLAPRPVRGEPAQESRSSVRVADAMENERWDVELDAVYYFTSAYDVSQFRNRDDLVVDIRTQSAGAISVGQAVVGRCPKRAADGVSCAVQRVTDTPLRGKDQLSLRLGGDYNPLPGLLSLRAGVSYETDGVDAAYAHPIFNLRGRLGLHAGMTLRLAGRTDLSLAIAHFLQPDLFLVVNDSRYPRNRMGPEYNYPQTGDHVDGTAGLPVPSSGDSPPAYLNAGTHSFQLTVLSASVSQHF